MDCGSPLGKLWIYEVTASGDVSIILDEGWDRITNGESIIVTSQNRLSVAGTIGFNHRDRRFNGQIYMTSELPNSVRTGFNSTANRLLLLSAYPNPFNGVATFIFTVGAPAAVQIDIFNALGRRQAELVRRRYDVGRHNISWDAGGLPSGDYFARMTAGNRVSTQKVTMLE